MKTKCTGLMGQLFGHNFRPVITLSASTFNSSGVRCKAHIALEMTDKYRAEEYQGCFCQRCGVFNTRGDMKIVGNKCSNDNPRDNPVFVGAVKGEENG